ncbi:GNAT family N-acetyltransferase [Companilactobacillus pabuli]|uniref:GNAT family N-acetyltransferase n=1 Tax=Companilactobacillus pabuli TaxID=2714036 RepID=UPI002415C938|nr:GNAT family N-acetyltransferase [Companilactobacillus pabuli]MDG5113643.1 GNAT family N-acetyltransferase [Companilactobacillus pabuli]
MDFRSGLNSDKPQIINLLVDSFKEYITTKNMFQQEFRSSAKFDKLLRKYFELEVNVFMKKGLVYVGADGKGKPRAVALIEFNQGKRISNWDYLSMDGLKLLPEIIKNGFNGFNAFDIFKFEDLFDKVKGKKKCAVEYLAVDKKLRGQGIGSKMLNNHISPYVKKIGYRNIILETNTQKNVKFYKKNNFSVRSVKKVNLSHGDVKDWVLAKTI